MRILVTGGAGFIGSHLCQRLLQLGHSIAVIDNFSDFYPRELKLRNLREVLGYGSVGFHEVDICDSGRLDAIFDGFRPEAVIHLAAEAGLRRSLQLPLQYERANVYGTLSCLESCRNFSVNRFIFASSSSVYGATSNVPFREDDEALYPLSPYAASKLAAEKMCYVYAHLYGLRTFCLRLFTVYGPRQRPDLAIRKFIEHIESGTPITMFGDGSSGRDYTYVADIVNGVVKTLECDAQFEIINLGNSSPVTLNQMIGTLENTLGKKAIVQRKPWNASESPVTCASIKKAARLLGYRPETSFAEGIAHTIEWFRNQADKPLTPAGEQEEIAPGIFQRS